MVLYVRRVAQNAKIMAKYFLGQHIRTFISRGDSRSVRQRQQHIHQEPYRRFYPRLFRLHECGDRDIHNSLLRHTSQITTCLPHGLLRLRSIETRPRKTSSAYNKGTLENMSGCMGRAFPFPSYSAVCCCNGNNDVWPRVAKWGGGGRGYIEEACPKTRDSPGDVVPPMLCKLYLFYVTYAKPNQLLAVIKATMAKLKLHVKDI